MKKEEFVRCSKIARSLWRVLIPSNQKLLFSFPTIVCKQGQYNCYNPNEVGILVSRLLCRFLKVYAMGLKKTIPEWLFDKTEIDSVLKYFNPQSQFSGTYYNAILQNLYFAILSNPKDNLLPRIFAYSQDYRDFKCYLRYAEMFKLSESDVVAMFDDIDGCHDYIFQCLDMEKGESGIKYYADGFSRNNAPTQRAFVPNCLFFGFADGRPGLLDVLYNFEADADEVHAISDMYRDLMIEYGGKIGTKEQAEYLKHTIKS